MRDKSQLSIARRALDEIEERTNEYLKNGYVLDTAKALAEFDVKEKYAEFDTRVVEKAEGS